MTQHLHDKLNGIDQQMLATKDKSQLALLQQQKNILLTGKIIRIIVVAYRVTSENTIEWGGCIWNAEPHTKGGFSKMTHRSTAIGRLEKCPLHSKFVMDQQTTVAKTQAYLRKCVKRLGIRGERIKQVRLN